MFRPVGQLRFQLPWSGANSASRSRKHFLRSNIWTNSTLLFHFFFSRCVWPSRERPRTCRASSLSATGARLTGPAPPMGTRNPGAQQSEFIFDQISVIDTEFVFEIFISQYLIFLLPQGGQIRKPPTWKLGGLQSCLLHAEERWQLNRIFLSRVFTINMIGSKLFVYACFN